MQIEEHVYEVPRWSAVVVRCDQTFFVYELVEKVLVPTGPDTSEARVWRDPRVARDLTMVIHTDQSANLAVSITPVRHEAVDPEPVEWPAGLKAPPSLEDRIRRLIRTELSRQAEEAGGGSFEEEDDFEDEDYDPLPMSPYEIQPMQEERPLAAPPPPTDAKPASSPAEPAKEVPPGITKPEPAPAST